MSNVRQTMFMQLFESVGLRRRVKAFCAISLSLAGSFFNNSFHVLFASPGRCAGRVTRQLHPVLSTVYGESPPLSNRETAVQRNWRVEQGLNGIGGERPVVDHPPQ